MDYRPDTMNAIGLADVFANTLRRPKLILSCAVLGLLGGLAIVTLVDPSYQTEAKILIERNEVPQTSNGAIASSTAEPVDERHVASQVTVMQSSDFADVVVKRLDLANNDKFVPPKLSYGFIKSLAANFGFIDDKRALSTEIRAILETQNSLTVFSPLDANVIHIKATSGDPQMAASLSNAMADEYVKSTMVGGDVNSKRVQEWLGIQIQELRQKVSDSENAAEKFRAEAGLIKGANSTLGVQEISELNSQLTLAEAALTEAEVRSAEIKSVLARKGSVDGSSEVLSSPIIQSLQQQHLEANRVLTELSGTYLANHPKIRAARKQTSEIEKQIRKEALKIVEGLAGQAKVAAARANAIRESLDQKKGRESAANLDDIELKALEREATANRQLLETLLARYVDANTRSGSDFRPTLARVIQKAQVPTAITFPRVGPIVLLSSLGGLSLGLGLAFLAALMRMAVGNPAVQVRQNIVYERPARADRPNAAQPVSGPIFEAPAVPIQPAPDMSFRPAPEFPITVDTPPVVGETAVADPGISQPIHYASTAQAAPAASFGHEAGGGLTESIRELRLQTLCTSFAFTRVGCDPIESALGVFRTAKELAAEKNRVLVIDLDYERAELERLFNLPEGQGLLDLFSGQSDFSKLICRDAQSGVHVIRLGDIENMPDPNVLASRIAAVLRSVTAIYDYVLIHVGKASAESLPIVKICDAAAVISPPTHDAEALLALKTLTEKSSLRVLHVSVERPEAFAQEALAAVA